MIDSFAEKVTIIEGLNKQIHEQKILIIKLKTYLAHNENCTKLCHMKSVTFPSIALDCNCGLDELIKKVEKILKTE